MRLLAALASTAALAAAARAPPPLGPTSVLSVRDLKTGPRHCNYVMNFMPEEDGNQDFAFSVVAALNGDANARSFTSADFPTYYWTIVNTTSGALGIAESPNVDDASFVFVDPLAPAACPAGSTDCYSLQTASKNPSFAGKYFTWSNQYNAPCNYGPPNGDALLTSGAGYDLSYLTFLVGPLPPNPAANITVSNTVTNPSVNKRFMGCHSDYGFAQTPRGFYANLVYGSTFEPGTIAVPSWTTRLADGASGSTGLATGEAFATKPSMDVTFNKPAPAAAGGGQVGLVNRGIGYAGFSLVAGQPYEVEMWMWAGDATTAFAELRDYTTNTSLARYDFAVQTTGPDWGSTWFRYNFTLTPTAGTECVGIPFGSDPTIDCGGDAGPAHVCVRCGGELYVGLSAPGDAKIGYVSLMPGPWGRLVAPDGRVLPVLKSGSDILTQMGITLIRSGGSVSQSMRWKDWRGPAWNRPSSQQIWGESLLAGWGPFDVIDMCNALGIEPVVTLAYDANDALDWADLVEYCWGDASTTSWGARRAADGHPQPYNITVFELGNEQYNPFYVDQVLAMEARAKAVGAPPLHYMFPDNAGINAADAARLLAAAPDVIPRTMPDLHVGAGGAVEAAEGLFNAPPVPGYNQSAINCETNAGTHDMTRALNEASDLIDFFTAPTAVTDRIYARTASFCTGTSAQFDSWDQGISFFLPNMTWLQPPGWVHVMVSNTWAEQTLQATKVGGGGDYSFAAQRTADGTTLVFRAVSGSAAQPLNVNFAAAGTAAGPTFTLWTLTGPAGGDNTPGNPNAIAPAEQQVPITAGATSISYALQAHTFAVMVVKLQ